MIADTHGGVLTLGERECSIQRRHQKLIEEAPSPALTPELREEMETTVERASRSIGYTNAGTFEFLLGPDGAFYFIELNARLQVEHPVSELVTGIDLVHEQVRIAAGEPLEQTGRAPRRGHALEVRVNAEDPERGFLPGARHRHAVSARRSGPASASTHTSRRDPSSRRYYDSLLAKVIVWAPDRDRALARSLRALNEFEVAGIPTTIGAAAQVIRSEGFARGDYSTSYLDDVVGGAACLRRGRGMTTAVAARAGPRCSCSSSGTSRASRSARPTRARWTSSHARRQTAVAERAEELDRRIDEATDDWPADRLGALERNVLRIGIYELEKGEVPPEVAIDEAVRLAKRYASDEAGKLVNGILGRIEREGAASER